MPRTGPGRGSNLDSNVPTIIHQTGLGSMAVHPPERSRASLTFWVGMKVNRSRRVLVLHWQALSREVVI